MDIKKLELRALLSKLESLEIELQMVEAVNENFMTDFLRAVGEYVRNYNLQRRDIIEEAPITCEKKITEDKNKMRDVIPEDVKKLYRQIAVMTHPDKVTDLGLVDEMSDMFKQATMAFDNGDLFELIKLANKLNIKDFEITSEHMDLIKERIKRIERDLGEEKNSFIYMWYTIDEKNKDKIIKKYVNNQYI